MHYMKTGHVNFLSSLADWVQYLAISFLASSVAFNAYEASQRLQAGGNIETTISEINIHSMLQGMWHQYYRWWLLTFLGLMRWSRFDGHECCLEI